MSTTRTILRSLKHLKHGFRLTSPPHISHRLLTAISISGSAVAALFLLSGDPQAHDAPSGWSYPYECCHDMDCRPVSARTVKERAGGYVITDTGELVGYKDRRVRQSPDGLYHWCSIDGRPDSRTICLFVPAKSF